MKKLLLCCILVAFLHFASAQMMITGVVDGPLPGGTPKAIEFFVTAPISNLSEYGLGVANNGGGSDGKEYTFNGTAQQGEFLYFAHGNSNGVQAFQDFFGFSPDFTSTSFNLLFNGDDAIELYRNGNVIDLFGSPSHGGSPSWNYTDGWAYRTDRSAPSGNNFPSGEWNEDPGALTGATQNGNNGSTAFPIGSYQHIPLPIVLTNFEAKLQNETVVLNWQTERELNNAYFEVERMNDDSNWQNMGQIAGAGTTQNTRKYLFIDRQPAFGKNVYRLKQIDIDGTYTYSPLTEVNLDTISIHVFPNPFYDHIKITLIAPKHERLKVSMYSILGEKVSQWGLLNEYSSYDLQVPQQLADGIYLLKIEIGTVREIIRMVKAR